MSEGVWLPSPTLNQQKHSLGHHPPNSEHSKDELTFFFISKKKILLIKEKQEKHKEFMVVNKGKRNNKTKTAPNIF